MSTGHMPIVIVAMKLKIYLIYLTKDNIPADISALCLCGDNLTCCMLHAEQRAAVHLLTRILISINTAAAAADLQRMTAWLY